MNGTTWREKALAAAREFYERDVIDGTPEGNRIIGMEIIGGATGYPDPAYVNGKVAWCGYMVQCCYRAAGFNHGAELASTGKVLEVFGRYRPDAVPGSVAWALDTHTGAIERIKDLHARLGLLRRADRLPAVVQPGDILLHCRPDSWHGHVMMAWSVNADGSEITVVEGNSTHAIGPDGRMREGVGLRVIRLAADYLDFVVSPSDTDFDPAYRYFVTQQGAEAARVKIWTQGMPNG